MSIAKRVLTLALMGSVSLWCSDARADDHGLFPVGGGVIVSRDGPASFVTSGLGMEKKGVSVEALGRAVVTQHRSLGLGGVRGGFALLDRKEFQFGLSTAVTVGGGRERGRPVGLVVAAEPGFFARYVPSKKIAFGFGVAWMQPLRVAPEGVQPGVVLTLSVLPGFGF